MRMTVMVGQAESRRYAGRLPFDGATGKRLCTLAGLSSDEFKAVFHCVNLVPWWPGSVDNRKGDDFPMKDAKGRAASLLRCEPYRLVLLGKSVARAFGIRDPEFLEWHDLGGCCLRAFVYPHPSGVSHWWNDPINEDSARMELRRITRCAIVELMDDLQLMWVNAGPDSPWKIEKEAV